MVWDDYTTRERVSYLLYSQYVSNAVIQNRSKKTMTIFEDQDCCSCGVRFGVPAGYTANRRKDKALFYCPNGCSMSYKESEADRLRKENQRLIQDAAYKDDRIKSERERADRERNIAIAYKGQCTKLKKRAKQGVCPCCNRMFMDMQAHMTTKHPHFDPDEPIKLVSKDQEGK